MYIEIAIFSDLNSLKTHLVEIIEAKFLVNETQANLILNRSFNQYFRHLRSDLYFLVETNYVDKFYRDTFYHYFSSKSGVYVKNCIRISLFNYEIKEDDFRNHKKFEILKEKFCGFIVLRPTIPAIVGRSVLSPQALTKNNFYICKVEIPVTINGVKMKALGFPHAAQDSENITCAETSIWALMEYYGNRYAEYSPILPSLIIESLNTISFERQIPSKGLNILHLSYALKKFGFGSVIYSRGQYKESFARLLSTYIESGIPIIVGKGNDRINHALLCIGHSNYSDIMLDSLASKNYATKSLEKISKSKNISVYDTADIKKKFVFIDDNMPSYQTAYLDQPSVHYPDSSWHTCQISHFIVPLYPRIYLEAYKARNFIFSYLLQSLKENSEVLTRIFLASSRSFKNHISWNFNINETLREMIISTSLPKFIWVAEVSNKDLYKKGSIEGLVLVDATEAVTSEYKPLILSALNDRVVFFNEETRFFDDYDLVLTPFELYRGNLTQY